MTRQETAHLGDRRINKKKKTPFFHGGETQWVSRSSLIILSACDGWDGTKGPAWAGGWWLLMDRSVLGDGCPCPRDVMDAPALGTRLCKELDAAGEGMGQGGLHLAAEPKQGLPDPSEPKRGRSCKICSHTRGQSLVCTYKWQAAKPACGNVAKLPLRATVLK